MSRRFVKPGRMRGGGMSTPAFNPPRGRRPVLQNCALGELAVDPAYQRGLDNGSSRALIAAIARDWDWGLCQPLVVARRIDDGAEQLFVVDGQHRLAAARLRGDIGDLPCVVVSYGDAGGEAQAFVALNSRRRPLAALDLFRAALAAGDPEAATIDRLVTRAGLRLAPHLTSPWRRGSPA